MSIVVRSALRQKWYGDWYWPGDKMPANDKQAQALTSSGQAYYDYEKEEPELKVDFEDLPASDLLREHFDTINAVSFASDDELLAIKGIGQETLKDIRGFFQ